MHQGCTTKKKLALQSQSLFASVAHTGKTVRDKTFKKLLSSASLVNSECRRQQLSDGVRCPRLECLCIHECLRMSDLCNITNKDFMLIYMQRATENTRDNRDCWRLLCVWEREGVFWFFKVVSSLLPAAWREEPECGAHWGLVGALGARTAADCWPRQAPKERGGQGSSTPWTPWRINSREDRLINDKIKNPVNVISPHK